MARSAASQAYPIWTALKSSPNWPQVSSQIIKLYSHQCKCLMNSFSISICLNADFDYCSGVQCPTGGICANLSSNFTYSCTCTAGYSVSGTQSSSSPLIQTCATATTTTATTSTVSNPCGGITCATNAQCISTSATGYCACISGYYGSPVAGGNCKQDTGNSQVRVLCSYFFLNTALRDLLEQYSNILFIKETKICTIYSVTV